MAAPAPNITRCLNLPPLDTLLCLQSLEGLNVSSCTSGGIPYPLTNNATCGTGMSCPNLNVSDPATWPQICPPSVSCVVDRLSSTWCPSQGKYEPSPCEPGYYCPDAWTQLQCPSGTWCVRGTTTPRECDLLTYCPAGTRVGLFYGGILIVALIDIALLTLFIWYRYTGEPARSKAASAQRGPSLIAAARANKHETQSSVGRSGADGRQTDVGEHRAVHRRNFMSVLLCGLSTGREDSQRHRKMPAAGHDDDSDGELGVEMDNPSLAGDVAAVLNSCSSALCGGCCSVHRSGGLHCCRRHSLPDGVVVRSGGRVRTRSIVRAMLQGELVSRGSGIGVQRLRALDAAKRTADVPTVVDVVYPVRETSTLGAGADSSNRSSNVARRSTTTSAAVAGVVTALGRSIGAAVVYPTTLWGAAKAAVTPADGACSSSSIEMTPHAIDAYPAASPPRDNLVERATRVRVVGRVEGTAGQRRRHESAHAASAKLQSAQRDDVAHAAASVLSAGFRRANAGLALSLEFSGLSLTLPPPTNKTILSSVSGSIHPGRVTAIMGPSGAGKTTFLSVLMGRSRRTAGTLRINGEAAEMSSYRRATGFVPQDDTLLNELTVRECIAHAAQIRLPRHWTGREIEHHVDAVIVVLGLSGCADTITGRCSGGQRKRANIGIELAAAPAALFLDEPTRYVVASLGATLPATQVYCMPLLDILNDSNCRSGLDATAALEVCRALRAIADLGLTVVAVLHQPREEIFASFDDLLLLAPGGLTVYMGAAAGAAAYFASIVDSDSRHNYDDDSDTRHRDVDVDTEVNREGIGAEDDVAASSKFRMGRFGVNPADSLLDLIAGRSVVYVDVNVVGGGDRVADCQEQQALVSPVLVDAPALTSPAVVPSLAPTEQSVDIVPRHEANAVDGASFQSTLAGTSGTAIASSVLRRHAALSGPAVATYLARKWRERAAASAVDHHCPSGHVANAHVGESAAGTESVIQPPLTSLDGMAAIQDYTGVARPAPLEQQSQSRRTPTAGAAAPNPLYNATGIASGTGMHKAASAVPEVLHLSAWTSTIPCAAACRRCTACSGCTSLNFSRHACGPRCAPLKRWQCSTLCTRRRPDIIQSSLAHRVEALTATRGASGIVQFGLCHQRSLVQQYRQSAWLAMELAVSVASGAIMVRG